MANSQDLIDFDIIETQKENIQSLASGRSAKALAQIFSPAAVTSPLSHTQDLNDAIRAEYEKELTTIDDSDDPLDIYDRYVRWTLNAYPSAQATPASQLLPLLERATKTFLGSDHYKNDPRYLKLWLNYIRLFSDSPRETFAYLARHGIGAELALYYEEFAAWFETCGRWIQAEEVYKMGIERRARPTERLMRKFTQFQKRAEVRQSSDVEPRSPALPTVRPALAARIDPFAPAAVRPIDPQVQTRMPTEAAPRRQKLQIFSDEGANDQPPLSTGANVWGTIESVSERKKENVITARTWAGEKLNVGGRQNAGVPKMPIFRDESQSHSSIPKPFQHPHLAREQESMNQNSGKLERIFVNLERVYPNPENSTEEYCLEELRAAERGWLDKEWSTDVKSASIDAHGHDLDEQPAEATTVLVPPRAHDVECSNARPAKDKVPFNDENLAPSNVPVRSLDGARRAHREDRANRTRKIKVREVKNETQTIQTNMSSPKGPKLRRKRSAEPTMTLHTKAATDEIYEIFNEPLMSVEPVQEDTDSDDGSDDEDEDDYTSAGESTGTGHISEVASEFGEDTQGIVDDENHTAEPGEESADDTTASEMTGPTPEAQQLERTEEEQPDTSYVQVEDNLNQAVDAIEKVAWQETSVEMSQSAPLVAAQYELHRLASSNGDPDSSRRPYRGIGQTAHSRLPFMTPIVEKTESSLGTATSQHQKDYFNSKTPCPKAAQKTPVLPDIQDELFSSPFQEDFDEYVHGNTKIRQPVLSQPKLKRQGSAHLKPTEHTTKDISKKEPTVKDAQCNPMDETIRKLILENLQPPLSSFGGFHDHAFVSCNRKAEIRKYCKSMASMKASRITSDKTASTVLLPPILNFEGAARQYAVKRELGAGAYAPVYLVEGIEDVIEEHDHGRKTQAVMGKGCFALARCALEAVKMEEPPSPWEFYIIRTAHRRLGVSRASDSIVQAYEMHLFQDEGYLVEEYREQGTLLDLVNAFVRQNNNGSAMEEPLAIFFMIELLRTVESLHSKGIIHCDLKADNVLVRLPAGDEECSAQYHPDGSEGWSQKGVTLIDLGRGIDMRAFRPDVQFTADWETSPTDCAEMREMRPWTYQADYHGLAAIAHTMLYGRYIETVAEKGAGTAVAGGKTHRLRESMKRYWQGEIWNELFTLLLNPGRHVDQEDGQRMPCLRGMKAVRTKMEACLVANGEKGAGLKTLIRRAELLAVSRKRA